MILEMSRKQIRSVGGGGGGFLVAQMLQHHSLFSSLFPKPDPGGPGCLRVQFVIVSGPFLAVTVKPISSGTTAKMTLGGGF